jgi:hypothetical protein
MTSRAGCASRPAPLVSVALALALALAPGASLAQVGATQQQALAEALFEEGKRLMVAERYDEACPRLAESQQAEPAGGTVLLLAVCLERQGKLASAWASFSEALVVARRDRNAQRTSVARQHLAALSPRLTRLVVRVSTELSTLPGLVVLRDGVPLPAASWDTALPVDAGAHVIEARSPGQEPVRVEVEARGEGAVVTVLLSPPAAGASLRSPPSASSAPGAQGAPSAASAASAAFVPPGPIASSSAVLPGPAGTSAVPQARGPAAALPRWPGYAVAGLGVVSLIVGTAAAVHASSLIGEVEARCPQTRCADPEARGLNDRARFFADLATVALPLGAISLGGGAWWALRASPAQVAAGWRARGTVEVGGRF